MNAFKARGLEKKMFEQYEQKKMSRREFLDKATDGLFKEKRRKVAERYEKFFGKKMF
jgi:hypothetical protein